MIMGKAVKRVNFLFVIAMLVISFMAGSRYGKKASKEYCNDTITVNAEPITYRCPVASNKRITGHFSVPVVRYSHDTVCVRDTVYLPITQKEYSNESYHAWVSGYEPSLDSITILPKETVITKYKKKKWGIGVFAGYGISSNGFCPSIGIGLTYTLF